MPRVLNLIFILLFICCKSDKKDPTENQITNYKTIGSIEKLDAKLDALIAPETPIEIIASGYTWTEGPLWLPEEEMLIWSDVPENKIYSWKEGEDAKLYLKPSGFTGENPASGSQEGSNGLLLDSNGNLILCQHGDRRVARMNTPLTQPAASFTTLIDNYEDKALNSPNDAAYDNSGNLYFTDPPYGLHGIENSKDKVLTFNGVYKFDVDGNLEVMTDSLSKPNGIAFNNNFTKCYVANSDPEKAYWVVYDVSPERTFSNGRLFFDATDRVPEHKGLPDGLKVDNRGNLYATGPGGVLIFSSEGVHLGTIKTGQATANCAFNSDKSTLFITADSYILKVNLRSTN